VQERLQRPDTSGDNRISIARMEHARVMTLLPRNMLTMIQASMKTRTGEMSIVSKIYVITKIDEIIRCIRLARERRAIGSRRSLESADAFTRSQDPR